MYQDFTDKFNEGYRLLGLDDQKAARLFGTSVPNIRRWKSGKAVPPAASMIIVWMLEEVAKEAR